VCFDAVYAEVEKDFVAVPATFDKMYAHSLGGQVIFARMTDEQTRQSSSLMRF
jgi:hypothetical protein